MDLQKYKTLLFQKIKKQISLWFETNENVLIPNEEVHRFLHSIHGSSGTLQLVGLFQLSGRLITQIQENAQKSWSEEDLRNFLDELIDLSYEYENFHEKDQNKDLPREDHIPLIQIIDADISMLILIKEYFEERGWMIVGNNNPIKAISQFVDLNPDCVLIDTYISGMNGFHLLQELQSLSHHQFIPKIMTSLINNRETRIKAYQTGADLFFEKPLDLEELAVCVDHLLKRKKLFDQSAHLDDHTKLYNRKTMLGDAIKSSDQALYKAKENGRDRVETITQKPLEIKRKPLYVSIIDDDAIIRTMLLKILKTMETDHHELQLEAFENGLKFFDSGRLDENGQHFLILDGVMPVMDGIEILQKVRKMKMDTNLHVLMLTGRKSESDIERALKLGADDYVTKPFSIKELQARIQRLIKRMK